MDTTSRCPTTGSSSSGSNSGRMDEESMNGMCALQCRQEETQQESRRRPMSPHDDDESLCGFVGCLPLHTRKCHVV
jgi:hypothetical protein